MRTIKIDEQLYYIQGNKFSFHYLVNGEKKLMEIKIEDDSAIGESRKHNIETTTLQSWFKLPKEEGKLVFVFDRDIFNINDIITADLKYGDNFIVASEPYQYKNLYFYDVIPDRDFKEDPIKNIFLNPGIHYGVINCVVGEFN